MKKFLSVAVGILFLMIFGQSVLAQSESTMIALPPGGGPAQLFGQNQWYSVVFRGNGEAIVNLRTVFSNSESSPLTHLTFRVPKAEPKDLMAFQVIAAGPCLRYGPAPDTQSAVDTGGAGYAPNRCLAYGEPEFSSWYGPAKYQKAKTQYSGDTITVILPQPVSADKTGSILLYFRAFGYAKKDFAGSYHFTFETLKAEDQILQLQLGISTDSDLVLRGTKGKVNYRFEDAGVASKSLSAEAAAPVANNRMDAYYQQIGQGQINKSASNLQALESYTVKGSYADNSFKLYAKEILVGLLVIILLAGAFVWIGKALLRGSVSSSAAKPANRRAAGVVMSLGLSFVSSLVILGLGAIMVYLTRNLSGLFGYEIVPLVTVLILLLFLAVVGFLLVAPGLFVGIKRGWGLGLATTGLTIMWLFIGVVLLLLFFGFSNRAVLYDGGGAGIMPMMEKTVQSFQGSPDVQAPMPEE